MRDFLLRKSLQIKEKLLMLNRSNSVKFCTGWLQMILWKVYHYFIMSQWRPSNQETNFILIRYTMWMSLWSLMEKWPLIPIGNHHKHKKSMNFSRNYPNLSSKESKSKKYCRNQDGILIKQCPDTTKALNGRRTIPFSYESLGKIRFDYWLSI